MNRSSIYKRYLFVPLLLVLLFCIDAGLTAHNISNVMARKSITNQNAVTAQEVIKTESGLQVTILKEGTGPKPQAGQFIAVHYTGKLQDGTEFDSSLNRGPYTFQLGVGEAIAGWDEGIALLREGSEAVLIIPPELAYGENGVGDGLVPPNATLTFTINLVQLFAPVTPFQVDEANFIETESGLKYYDIKVGEGELPAPGSIVNAHYTGWLNIDDSRFDSSLDRGYPFTFALGKGQVIAGWEQGVSNMRVGGKRQLIMPSELAYGDEGYGEIIPPDATLKFDVELVGILPIAPDQPTAINDGDFIQMSNGLKYYDIEVGEGSSPKIGDVLDVHYTGWLADGTKFDSSLNRWTPFRFQLGREQVITGWDEGLRTMKVGGKRQLVIPPELAYGVGGYEGVIPDDATLTFEVELMDVAASIYKKPTVVDDSSFIETDSGLKYYEIEVGEGDSLEVGDVIDVHYTGWLTDGAKFDSSLDRGFTYRFPFTEEEVIAGWTEVLSSMQIGGKRQVMIPPELAYGANGYEGIVPDNSTLIFEIEVVRIFAKVTDKPTEVNDDEFTESDSGLKYYDIEVGEGDSVEDGDMVDILYTGWFTDGVKFDGSLDKESPIRLRLGAGQVIAGWDEGIDSMQVGGKRQLVLPPELAYGDFGYGNLIPGGATLTFEVELVEIQPKAPDEPTEVDNNDFSRTDNGLQYYDLEVGEGDSPEDGDVIDVHYTGWLLDGSKFDSSLDRGIPFSFVVGESQVIAGWEEGFRTMKPGGKRQLVVPSALAYGDEGYEGVIPGGATLIFEVELIAIQE